MSLPGVFLVRMQEIWARKIPVTETFHKVNSTETWIGSLYHRFWEGGLAKVSPGEFCKISNSTFFYIAPQVTTSADIEMCIGVSKIQQMMSEYLTFYGFISRAFRWMKTCNFIKKETLTYVFSYKFCEILKNNFLTKHLQTAAFV